jgi:protein-tyrosine-phosphatase
VNTQIIRILCLCIGNGDRSPVMAAFLALFLKNGGYEVDVESAGVAVQDEMVGLPHAKEGALAAGRIGLDLSQGRRRRAQDLKLEDYDLFVVAGDSVGADLDVIGKAQGLELLKSKKIHNADIPNPWPIIKQEVYDEKTILRIIPEMYNVIRYFGDRMNRIPLAGKTEKRPAAL